MITTGSALQPTMSPILRAFCDGLMPATKITVSEWADKYRRLSASASSESGQYRTERTPFMKDIMDALSVTSTYREIIFMKSSQVGSSEAGFNWIGYIIDVEPASTLLVMPTESMYKITSKTRIDPMIEDTPRLKEKFINNSNGRDSNNTVDFKGFRGGFLRITNAGSPSALASMPIRNVMLDEVDRYPQDVKGEGSPVDLARARTRTFPNRKIFIGSTPTIEGLSVVEREFINSDQRYYHMPCPYCGVYQKFIFENLKYVDKNPDTVYYECVACNEHIKERHKTKMMSLGNWVPENPGLISKKRIGFHINALYSPLGMFSWSEIIQEWLDAQGNVPKLKTFFNTILGKSYKEDGEAPPWSDLYKRRETYDLNTLNDEIGVLTMGVDVQKDRLEYEIVGWGKRKRSWSVNFDVIEGDTSHEAVWNELKRVIDETRLLRPDGNALKISMTAVDTGYNTHHAYNFCRQYQINQVIAVKGRSNMVLMMQPPKKVDVNIFGKQVGTLMLYNVASDLFKQELYGWLRLQIGDDGHEPEGYCHFPHAYGEDHFKSLTAERMEPVTKKGYTTFEWVKRYERNEKLDCRVYARVASYYLRIDSWSDADWERYSLSNPEPVRQDGVQSTRPAIPSSQTKRVPNKSDYWNRRK